VHGGLKRATLDWVTQTNVIRCVVYAAKSTEDRRGSIPDQLAECRGALDGEPGRTLTAEYTDEAFSAFKRNRGPGLLDAMEHTERLAREHGIAELWAQHSDRLARGDGKSARHAVEIALWALKNDVKVRTVQDPDTFRDLLYAVVTGQRNHEDSRRKGLAIAAGRRRAAARGESLGHRPDGYLAVVEIDEDGAVHKRTVMDPRRRPVIEMIFGLALRGGHVTAIAWALNEAGWLTKPLFGGSDPKAWTAWRVKGVLRNPRYAGLSVVKGEVLARGQWPAYITPHQHERLRGGSRGLPMSPHRETYLLARLATCGRCGSSLRARTQQTRKDGTIDRRYACTSHLQDCHPARCRAPRVPADVVEAMFVASLRTLLVGVDRGEREQNRKLPAVRPVERQSVIDAVLSGDDHRTDAALASLVVRRVPQVMRLRPHVLPPQQDGQPHLLRRFQSWAEQERIGRTDASREEVHTLNSILATWFCSIAITVDDKSVTIVTASRPAKDDPAAAIHSEVQLDVQDWMRLSPHAYGLRKSHRRWADADIIAALQAWTDTHGRLPRSCDWLERELDHPSPRTVLRHFDTWARALQQAGLEPPTGVARAS
jgi:hypothetical protein